MPIPASLRAELGIADEAPATGGCIHQCYRVRIGSESRFLKLNAVSHADGFAAEADGLKALRSAGMRAPAPLLHGALGDHAFLVLEYLELRETGDFAALGRMLARGHRQSGPAFGWPRDNYIGSTPQRNGWKESWSEFWWERRLRPQLALAKRNGFDLEVDLDATVLADRSPTPCLLHGDLWRGNAGFTPGGPVVFDPAVYYGDREADLAMTELFGGFPPEFYRAYQEAFALDEGHERRKPLYNLYHLLNHLNLFGGGYLAQVKATLGLLLRR